MTQVEKTEAAIDALPEYREVNSDVIAIARDLAAKLDAVMEWVAVAENSENSDMRRVGAALRAIVEGNQ